MRDSGCHPSVKHRVLKLIACLPPLALAMSLFPAYGGQNEQATEPLRNMTLDQLGQIQVTSVTKEPEEVWRTPAAIYVITQQMIQRSGATSIPEALRLAPGVEVARIDSNKWSIGIRGFGSRLSRDVLVMIDGRTVYTTLLAGTYWEVQNVPLQDVDRIEVIRGPGGTIWGPNAVNGVINIITKDTKDTRGEMVSVGGGNEDQGSVTVRYGAGNGKTFDYRAYGMAFDRGPELHSDGNNYDSWRDIQGGFRMDFSRHENDHFMVQGEMYKEGAGETVTSVTYAPPYSQTVRGTELLSGGDIVAQWHRVQGDGKDFQLEMYYDQANRREPNFEDLRNTFDADFLDRFRLPGRQQISWGFGARASHGANPTVVSGLYFLPESRTDQLYSGFVNDEWEIVPRRVSLSIGTKLLKTNYTRLDWQPSVRLLWTPGPSQSFWAAFTSALRTPSDAERAFYLTGFVGSAPDGTPIFARFNANPNFKSEELNGYEAGYRQLFGQNFYVDISAFYNQYSDLFSEDITGPEFFEPTPPPPHYLTLGAALVVSRIAQRRVSEPLVRLAETARLVSSDKNYSLRAPPSSRADEVALLIGSFNQMLAEIQKRDDALQEREEQFRTLADSVPQLAWMAEGNGDIFWYNQRWYQYTGKSLQEMLGWGWESVHDPEVLPDVVARWREAIRTGKRFEMVFPLRGRDGSYRDFLTLIVPVKDAHGAVVRWFGTNTDVTEQRRAEEALRESEKLAATGRLAASIAHEINNPLEAVANLLYLAKKQRSDATPYVAAAEQELDRIAEITRHTLGFYRDTSTAVEVNLSEATHGVLALYERKLQFKRITVNKRLSPDAAIFGFPGEIRQILANLVANAIDAMSTGGCLSLKVSRAHEWGGRKRPGVRVTVLDNGSGIGSEQMKKIFEPFYTTKKDVGTGLGLWLTQNLIRKHGGTIKVRSTSHKSKNGTTFSIFLPYQPDRQENQAEIRPDAAGGATNVRSV